MKSDCSVFYNYSEKDYDRIFLKMTMVSDFRLRSLAPFLFILKYKEDKIMSLSRVEIITGISKIEPLKKAFGKFHISGMTVYQVLGCGVQHGTQEFETDDSKKDISLLPKEVVMMVVPNEELDDLLEFVKKELYTGHIGDGKIFVSDVTNVIRVRTGEEGYSAVTDSDM